ncbi:MAG: radical SAM protein [Thermoplasmatota archaeon]
MTAELQDIVYGPVPSRRLGQSLGINNIPPKRCTYSCIYCQLGITRAMRIKRQSFYPPDVLVKAVERKVQAARQNGERIDYLTFVPDGEPTLDSHLGRHIEMLQPLGIDIAVITNGSLLWKRDVQDDLQAADMVSIKIDALSEPVWRSINRPHGGLQLSRILEGIQEFSRHYAGKLLTETMLVRNVNDTAREAINIAEYIEGLDVEKSYIAIPFRPPAKNWVQPANELAVSRAYTIFRDHGIYTEGLTGFEGDAFASTGDIAEDILSITSVHPMRKESVQQLLSKKGVGWEIIDQLLREGRLVETEYDGTFFYIRKLPSS